MMPALSPTRGKGQKLAVRKQAVLRGIIIAKRRVGKELKDFISRDYRDFIS
jgi:hypothetical protein